MKVLQGKFSRVERVKLTKMQHWELFTYQVVVANHRFFKVDYLFFKLDDVH